MEKSKNLNERKIKIRKEGSLECPPETRCFWIKKMEDKY